MTVPFVFPGLKVRGGFTKVRQRDCVSEKAADALLLFELDGATILVVDILLFVHDG